MHLVSISVAVMVVERDVATVACLVVWTALAMGDWTVADSVACSDEKQVGDSAY